MSRSDRRGEDLGGDWFVRRIINNNHRRDRLIGELQGMGYRVNLEKAAC